MAQRKSIAATKATKVNEKEPNFHFAFSVVEEKPAPSIVETMEKESGLNGESRSSIPEKDEEKAWKIKETKSRTQRIMESTQKEGQ